MRSKRKCRQCNQDFEPRAHNELYCPTCNTPKEKNRRKSKSRQAYAKRHPQWEKDRKRNWERKKYLKPCKGGCGNLAWHRPNKDTGYCHRCTPFNGFGKRRKTDNDVIKSV